MSQIESLGHIGIVGKHEEAIGVIRESLSARRFKSSVFKNADDVNRTKTPPDLIIVSEKEELPTDVGVLPRVILGSGKQGLAERFLDGGALDYIPTSGPIQDIADYIAAKVDRLFNRKNERKAPEIPITFLGIILDTEHGKLTIDGIITQMTLTERQILASLMKNLNKTVSREQLYEFLRVSEESKDKGSSSLTTHLGRIRRSLGDYRKHIQTLNGVGYQFTTHPEIPPTKLPI